MLEGWVGGHLVRRMVSRMTHLSDQFLYTFNFNIMLSYEHVLHKMMKRHYWYVDLVVRSKMMEKLGGQEPSNAELATLLVIKEYEDGTQAIAMRQSGEELIIIQCVLHGNGIRYFHYRAEMEKRQAERNLFRT